ncbi:MAG: DUF2238 domain-containing protein [Candidatus Woesearchaeota archaeon]|jgi:putative membrane protein|nr:DUF2238 domain-containing protein [Candidatus Woesearchaeota archaeon]MDP7622556.1 DUF2238 domain-containing protein [Candidatus Woesearchaeota archaeon]|tara:strand:- start:1747 stop:2334 length:588 start_codon:yes stop_codon:yes gene_type:complete
MLLKKDQIPILITNIIALIIFSFVFFSRKNYEFIIYIGVIIFFLLVIVYSNKKINYPNGVLWGLTLWSVLHMSGGGIFIGGKKLYELMIFQIVGSPYNIFKFDQFVHIVGFWVATIVMYHLLKPLLKEKKWISLSIVVVMAGLGAGALNEIVEFMATVIIPETGVGAYVNNSLDLVSNLVGAIGAMIYLIIKEKN